MIKTVKKSRASIHIKNELVQCYIRFSVLFLSLVYLSILKTLFPTYDGTTTLIIALTYSLINLLYLFVVRFRPQLFMTQRIMLIMLTDILTTTLCMYFAGPPAALFVSFYLIYILGFGMRYGIKYAVIATFATITALLVLFSSSPHWVGHPHHAFGWLIAFVTLPTYFFILVKRLNKTLKELNIALLKTEKLANFDNLTGLANRHYFTQTVNKQLAQGAHLTVFMLDLDGFKNVNDQFGHDIGDKLLIKVAHILNKHCATLGTVGRMGGDEFIVALNDFDPDKVAALAEQLLTGMPHETATHGQITVSIGICYCPGDAKDLSHAKSCADVAMYTAKKQGKNRYHFYSNENLS